MHYLFYLLAFVSFLSVFLREGSGDPGPPIGASMIFYCIGSYLHKTVIGVKTDKLIKSIFNDAEKENEFKEQELK